MNEKPILFSAPMIRAILDGRKTQTRRLLRIQPPEDYRPQVCVYSPIVVDQYGFEQPAPDVFGALDKDFALPCPYGQPGDCLWVRETFAAPKQYDHLSPSALQQQDIIPHIVYLADNPDAERGRTRSSIHMPRQLSRITLEIIAVRVERLKSITEEDAKAEGVQATDILPSRTTAKQSFVDIWEKIHGPGSWWWADSLWVWVVEFRCARRLHAA